MKTKRKERKQRPKVTSYTHGRIETFPFPPCLTYGRLRVCISWNRQMGSVTTQVTIQQVNNSLPVDNRERDLESGRNGIELGTWGKWKQETPVNVWRKGQERPPISLSKHISIMRYMIYQPKNENTKTRRTGSCWRHLSTNSNKRQNRVMPQTPRFFSLLNFIVKKKFIPDFIFSRRQAFWGFSFILKNVWDPLYPSLGWPWIIMLGVSSVLHRINIKHRLYAIKEQ